LSGTIVAPSFAAANIDTTNSADGGSNSVIRSPASIPRLENAAASASASRSISP
jgi:hypothetical protein